MSVVIQELEAVLDPPPAETSAESALQEEHPADPRPVLAALARHLWRARRLLAD